MSNINSTTTRTLTEENFNGISGAKRVTTTEGVKVDKELYANQYQKEGTLTAQLRQVMNHATTYPAIQVSDSLTDTSSLLSDQDFDLGQGQTYESKESRVAWINVPKDWTAEKLSERLAALPEARLYRIVSNRPILTKQQQAAVESEELATDMDTFADRQVVRYPDNSDKAGQIITDNNGKVQYRSVFFSATGMEDEDRRTAAPSDFYASATILSEIEEGDYELAEQELA